VSYLAAAERTGEWLLNSAERRPDGWRWPGQPGVSAEFGTGVGWGTAAPTMFFAEAFATTGDERWLEAARGGARWMAANLDDVAARHAGCGLFTGIGGWAVALDLIAESAGDEEAAALAGRALRAIAARADRSADGTQWDELTEILWGTAGIGCVLLTLGPKYLGPSALDLATGAGDWLLAEAEQAPRGIRWSLGASAYTGAGAEERRRRRYPNFAHGAAGIAFFLARLAQQTGERRFLDASLAATDWVMSTVRTDDGTCAAYHHEPDATDLFTLGWCHGPPGLGWLFRQLELCTGDPAWRSWLRRAARTDLISGIPARKEPGFWDNVARCCGSASVAEFFLDLHRLEGDPGDLEFATLLVDDLLGRAITDKSGTRWSNYEYRKAEPDLPPETGYLQGAPGIGSTLLRLHRHLAGDPWTAGWPHAPSWDHPAVRLRRIRASAATTDSRSAVLNPASARSVSWRVCSSITFSSFLPRSVSRSRTRRRSPGCGSRRSRPAAVIRVAALVTVGVDRPSRLAISPGDRPSSRHRQRSTNCCPSYTPCSANAAAEAWASACFADQKAVWKSPGGAASPLFVSDMARQAYAGEFGGAAARNSLAGL